MRFKKNGALKLYRLGYRYPRLTAGIFFCLLLAGLFLSSTLKLATDPIDLLPKNTESVQNLQEYKSKFGGNNFLMITVESPDSAVAHRFADDYVQLLEPLSEVVYVDFRRPVEFFKQRSWLYLDMDDLLEIKKRVARTLELEKRGVSIVFSNYLDLVDKEDKPDLTFDDILEKYKKKAWVPKQVSISADAGRFLVIRIKVNEKVDSFADAKVFLKKLEHLESDLKTKPGFDSVTVGHTGTLVNRLEESDFLENQIMVISVFVSIILLLVVYLYFRSWQSVVIIGVPLIVSVVITGGIVALTLGRLNVLTSFAGGIIAGLGSDYGIYLLNRFILERQSGTTFEKSIQRTFENTGLATFGSMLTTVGAFVGLSFSTFLFFKEFGIVGAVGVLVNYFAMVLLIPVLLVLFEKTGLYPIKPKKNPHATKSVLIKKILLFLNDRRVKSLSMTWPRVIVSAVILASLGVTYILRSDLIIRYDEKIMENSNLPGRKLFQRVNNAVQASLSPTVLMVKGEEEEARTVNALNAAITTGDKSVIDNVVGYSSLIPKNQAEKIGVLREIRNSILQFKLFPQVKKKEYLDSLTKSIEAKPVTRDELPDLAKRFFISPTDPDLSAVYLYPSFGRTSTETLARYHEGILNIIKKFDLKVVPVDSNFASDDIMKLISKESPRGLIMTMVFLTVVMLLLSRSFKRTVVVIFNLMMSVLLLFLIMKIFGIRLNIINIVSLPIILGTGIDSFIHFAQRYDETKDMLGTVKEKIPVILFSNLTSIIGFAGLMATSYSGIRSLGFVAVAGMFFVSLCCTLLFPRMIKLRS